MERDLHLIERDDGSVEVEFIKYPQYGNPHYVRRLLIGKEIERARTVIQNGNEYEIDSFCYSIA